jgi:WD40 repeat protein
VAAVPLPDGQTLLATASDDRTVRLWDPETGSPVGDPLTGHTAAVSAVAAVPLPDGQTLLATGGGDQTVRLWAPASGTGLKRLPVDAAVRALSPLGKGRLAVALDDGLLVLDLTNDIADTEPLSAPQAS